MSWSELLMPPGDYLAIAIGTLALLGATGLLSHLAVGARSKTGRIVVRLCQRDGGALVQNGVGGED